MITYWRIWAFSRVRNVHELKAKAIGGKLIWPDGSRYEKTEIRTAKQSATIRQLASKFKFKDVPEVIEDNREVPNETRVYFSKWVRFIPIALAFMAFVYGIFEIADGELYGYFLLGVAVFLYFLEVRKKRDPNPQIILNEKGIQTVHIKFMSWDNIENVKLKSFGRGRGTRWYLVIDFKEKDQRGYWGEQIDVSEFHPLGKKLMKIIKIYQQRYQQKFGNG